jgi:hypothetical protein
LPPLDRIFAEHLKVLEQAELIARVADGQHRRLNPPVPRTAADWLEFWTGSFDKLASLLAGPAAQ